MQDKFRAEGKKLYFGIVDLEKSFDRVPSEVIRWAILKLGDKEWLVSVVMSMYTGAKTVVRTVYGNSNGFAVKVGMHQGSALSPLLFVMVMEALSREFRVVLPWELLCADDLVMIAEAEDDLIKRLNEWKDFVENKGKGKSRTLNIAPQGAHCYCRGAEVHGTHQAVSHIPALYLSDRSRYSFTNPERMEGGVSSGPGCKEQLAHDCYVTAPSQRNSNPRPHGCWSNTLTSRP